MSDIDMQRTRKGPRDKGIEVVKKNSISRTGPRDSGLCIGQIVTGGNAHARARTKAVETAPLGRGMRFKIEEIISS